MATWTAADIPDQSGRTVVITGARSGLGLASAYALAAKGARVVMACRSAQAGQPAVDAVRQAAGHDQVELIELDLANLSSVHKAARQIRERTGGELHALINNAGVMAVGPQRTADGFEPQLGINHLGHAALTWLLMPALRSAGAARVVTVSSLTHAYPGLDLDDLNFEHRRYHPVTAYNQSKAANLLFAFELDRRLRADGADMISVAAHPGMSNTHLATNAVRRGGPKSFAWLVTAGFRLLGQAPTAGAGPQLYAATMPDVRGGQYYGPGGFGELRGAPKLVRASATVSDAQHGARLWQLTAELTKVDPEPA